MRINDGKMDLKIATEQLNTYLADPSKYQNTDGMELKWIELSSFPTSDLINNCDLESREESVAISKLASLLNR